MDLFQSLMKTGIFNGEVLMSVRVSVPLRRWFSIQNSQLVYQKKLKVSEAAPGDSRG